MKKSGISISNKEQKKEEISNEKKKVGKKRKLKKKGKTEKRNDLKVWIFQIERRRWRERGEAAGEVWASSPAEEKTKICGTASEEAAKECAWKSEQETRADGAQSSKESDQAREKKANQSCFWESAVIFVFVSDWAKRWRRGNPGLRNNCRRKLQITAREVSCVYKCWICLSFSKTVCFDSFFKTMCCTGRSGGYSSAQMQLQKKGIKQRKMQRRNSRKWFFNLWGRLQN